MNRQSAIEGCGECDRDIAVVQRSPWEFDLHCVCGFSRTVSWAHKAAPPIFESVQVQADLPLAPPDHSEGDSR